MRTGALALVLALVLPRPADAYVRTRTSTGTPLEWRRGCPHLVLGKTEYAPLPHDRTAAVLERSAATWNKTFESCSGLRVGTTFEIVDNDVPEFDGDNVVVWRLPGFCDDRANRTNDVCLAPNAAAITTVFYYDDPGASRDGELLDADIEINAVAFSFADDGRPDAVDLENTLTHELGHVLGFDHACVTSAGGAPAHDHDGQKVPSCFPTLSLPAHITEATMFPFESHGEINKRDLIEDESSGACAIYASHTNECASTVEGCGCKLGEPGGRGWPAVPLVAIAVLVSVRRKIRTRSGR